MKSLSRTVKDLRFYPSCKLKSYLPCIDGCWQIRCLGQRQKEMYHSWPQQAAWAQAHFMPVFHMTICTQCYKGGEVTPIHAAGCVLGELRLYSLSMPDHHPPHPQAGDPSLPTKALCRPELCCGSKYCIPQGYLLHKHSWQDNLEQRQLEPLLIRPT